MQSLCGHAYNRSACNRYRGAVLSRCNSSTVQQWRQCTVRRRKRRHSLHPLSEKWQLGASALHAIAPAVLPSESRRLIVCAVAVSSWHQQPSGTVQTTASRYKSYSSPALLCTHFLCAGVKRLQIHSLRHPCGALLCLEGLQSCQPQPHRLLCSIADSSVHVYLASNPGSFQLVRTISTASPVCSMAHSADFVVLGRYDGKVQIHRQVWHHSTSVPNLCICVVVASVLLVTLCASVMIA